MDNGKKEKIIDTNPESVQEVQFDKKAIPAIIAFVVLMTIGLFMFFYWRANRSSKVIEEADNEVTVAASIFPFYDITRSIVNESEGIKIIQLIPSDVDPETYEPTLDTKDKLSDTNIVFRIGSDFDNWLGEYASEDAKVVDLSGVVELIKTDGKPFDSAQGVQGRQLCEDNGGSWLSDYYECEGISQDVCEDNGGTFNSCASACRHEEDGAGCIEVCIAVCQFEEGEVISATKDYKDICEENNGDWLEEYNECEGLSQEVCEGNGGEYFLCESACRHEEGFDPSVDACIEVCIEVCKFEKSPSTSSIRRSSSQAGQADPYYWLSIENAKKISKTIYEEIVSLRPDLEETLYENYTQYVLSLDEAKSYIEGKVELLEDKRLIIFTESFDYFAYEYDLNIVATFDPSELYNPTDEFKQEFEKTLEEYNTYIVYKKKDVADEDIKSFLPGVDLEIRTLELIGGEEPILTYIDLMRFNVDSISGGN